MSIIAPVYREWDAFSEFVEGERVLMEFRLVYQGVLNSSGNQSASGNKHHIRRYLHKQLVNLWTTAPVLRFALGHNYDAAGKGHEGIHGVMPCDANWLMDKFKRGGKRYLPIVCPENSVTCSLDILLLRRDLRVVIASGDLDGRIKTLIDGLTIPVIGEDAEDGDEDPLYCLMSDDKYISEVKVTADFLFATPDQVIESPRKNPTTGEDSISTNHVFAIINVKTRGGMNLWA